LAVARGGTGQNFSAASQGSIIYFSATGTMATLSPGTAGQFLKTQGAGANPVWADAPSAGTNLFDSSKIVFSIIPSVFFDSNNNPVGTVYANRFGTAGRTGHNDNGLVIYTTASSGARVAIYKNFQLYGFHKNMSLRSCFLFLDRASSGKSITGFGNHYDHAEITKFCRFYLTGSTLYAEARDGSATTQVNITTGWGNLDAMSVADIIFTPGTSAKFYKNGTLLATITTNLPPSSDTTSFFCYSAYVETQAAASQSMVISNIIFERAI
jgi:hypothetical protein